MEYEINVTPKTILFLHIPKTAGTSLSNYFKSFIKSEDFFTAGELLHQWNIPSGVRFVCSHFWYGMHNRCQGNYEYITLLRNPVERILSSYFFLRETPAYHGVYIPKGMPLREFVQWNFGFALHNIQTRMLVEECMDRGVIGWLVQAWLMDGMKKN